ncbi:MAG: hypothetical protein OXD46_05970, partial [Chloroflexi bacterium]|nr:hypothetical protein [Chloroflexota bacterium]
MMILSERYKARRYAEGRAEGLADAVERAIRLTTREIDDSVEVRTDASQWFSRDVMRVVLTKGETITETFEVTMEQA